MYIVLCSSRKGSFQLGLQLVFRINIEYTYLIKCNFFYKAITSYKID